MPKQVQNNVRVAIRNELNIQAKSKTRDGVEYLVVPVVMILEGVHNGSLGPMFYSANVLSKDTLQWNGRPLTLTHPNTSANDPDVEEDYRLGRLYNTKFDYDTNALKADAWFEKRLVDAKYNKLAENLTAGDLVEVSTGMFVDLEWEEGSWKTEDYEGRVVNITADHLAILPEDIGACSIKDGAGLCRNEEQTDISSWESSDKIQNKENTKHKQGGATVDRTEQVQSLIDAGVINEDAKDQFEEMDEAVFNVFVELHQTALDADERAQKAETELSELALKPEPKKEEKKEVGNKEDTEVASLDALLENASGDLRNTIENALETYRAQRQTMVDAIVANEANTFTADELSEMSPKVLNGLYKMSLKKETVEEGSDVDFSGRVSVVLKSGEVEPLGLPSYEKESK